MVDSKWADRYPEDGDPVEDVTPDGYGIITELYPDENVANDGSHFGGKLTIMDGTDVEAESLLDEIGTMYDAIGILLDNGYERAARKVGLAA